MLNEPDGFPDYENYHPQDPPDISPQYDELGEDRVSVERTHTWREVAEDFAPYFDLQPAKLLKHIHTNRHEYDLPEDYPTDSDACFLMHQLWKNRTKLTESD